MSGSIRQDVELKEDSMMEDIVWRNVSSVTQSSWWFGQGFIRNGFERKKLWPKNNCRNRKAGTKRRILICWCVHSQVIPTPAFFQFL
jgi:hypothetical protein